MSMNYEEQCLKTKELKDTHMEYGGNATLTCINKVFGTEF